MKIKTSVLKDMLVRYRDEGGVWGEGVVGLLARMEVGG